MGIKNRNDVIRFHWLTRFGKVSDLKSLDLVPFVASNFGKFNSKIIQ